MATEQLDITGSCKLEAISYEMTDRTDVYLEYTEHSSDHWHSDSTTSVTIDKEKAQQMVDFLCKHFNITPVVP